jgi:hypothetical protein
MANRRRPELVRRDALRKALEKAEDGCVPCTQQYLELALRHGTSPNDIEQAINERTASAQREISRRAVLQILAAAGAGLALGSLHLEPEPALAYSFYWGTDTNTARASGAPPQNFYIGKLGGGVSQSNAFNATAASLAGATQTYMYWDVEGPASVNNTNHLAPYQWGVAQANAAYNAWLGDIYASYVQGVTIFGDVESSNYGYSGTTQADNQKVLQGWLDQIKSFANGGFTNGIYTGPIDWSNLLGTGYRPTRNFVLWITGCNTDAGSGNPCSQSASTTEANVQQLVNSNIGGEVFGGSQMVIWQYWASGSSGCGDYDVAIESPANTFYWINSASTWVCHGCLTNNCP